MLPLQCCELPTLNCRIIDSPLLNHKRVLRESATLVAPSVEQEASLSASFLQTVLQPHPVVRPVRVGVLN